MGYLVLDGFIQHVDQFEREFSTGVMRRMRVVPARISVRVLDNLGTERRSPGDFNETDVLGSRSDALRRALTPGGEGNISGVELDGGYPSAFFGPDLEKVPYAWTHEFGAFLRHKGRMPAYMFYMYAATGNRNWLYMALAARRRGGVQIKARPYYWKAVEEFFARDVDAVIDSIASAAVTTWEETGTNDT